MLKMLAEDESQQNRGRREDAEDGESADLKARGTFEKRRIDNIYVV